jgi:uncharacterized protein (DUF885 family)
LAIAAAGERERELIERERQLEEQTRELETDRSSGIAAATIERETRQPQFKGTANSPANDELLARETRLRARGGTRSRRAELQRQQDALLHLREEDARQSPRSARPVHREAAGKWRKCRIPFAMRLERVQREAGRVRTQRAAVSLRR